MLTARNSQASLLGRFALSAAIAAALHGGSAHAAEAPQGAALQEVVVTAQRTETSLQETPVSITAFGTEALQERGVTSLLEISAFTPNLQVGSRSGQGGNEGGYAIRGVGVNAGGSSPAVGIYVDDVYFPSGAGNLLGLFDVARVEVLRGPQGTLFGRNTIGGALQYVTVRPNTDDFGGFVEATGGNFNRQDFNGALNVPLGDTTAFRLSAGSRKRDGYVRDDFSKVDRGSDDTKQGRAQFRWTPTNDFTLDLKAEMVKQKSNGRAISVIGIDPNSFLVGLAQRGLPLPFFLETRPYNSSLLSTSEYQFPGFNAPEFFDFKYSIGQGTMTWNLTDALTLTSITAVSKAERSSASDVDNVPINIISVTTGHEQNDLFTQELRLTGKSAGNQFHWTTGVYVYDQSRVVKDQTATIGNSPTSPNGVDNDISSKAWAAYAQGTYDVTDRLSGTVGLRYSNEKITARALTPFFANGAYTSLKPSGDSSYTDTSPYYGLNFKVTPDIMTYAKVSKGFRAGGFQFANVLGLVPFKQETAWTYELGARMEFMDNRVRINPTIFWNKWNDIQFNALAPGIIIITQNAGDAEIKGGELEMQFAATENWLLEGSVSYLNGKYTRIDPSVTTVDKFPNGSFNPPPAPGTSIKVDELTLDDELQQSPELKYTAGVRYSLPLGNNGRIVANANYAWVDTIRSAVTRSNFVTMPSYSLLNAQVQYVAPSDRWSIALFGTNLTDEYYYIGGVNFGGLGPGSKEADVARPREYGATLRFNF